MRIIKPESPLFRTRLTIGWKRTCDCPPNHINCLTAKEWVKHQLGVWRVAYEKRDIRDKSLHPAAFPISLSKRVIELFTHRGELVLDPFVGSGTSLIAASDLGRNAVGIDLNGEYVDLCARRLGLEPSGPGERVVIQDDALYAPAYLTPETVSLIWTSPPYADLLNTERRNKSLHTTRRRNRQFGKVEQYSQNPRDLGTMPVEQYIEALKEIFAALLPLLRPGGHCVINVSDTYSDGRRNTLHILIVETLRGLGYVFRNTIIWDRTNLVNRVGIFGWPSNYITMGTSFEFLLHFLRPA